MRLMSLHNWDMDASSAIQLQKELAPLVSLENAVKEVRFVAGVDISVPRFGKTATGSVVVLSCPELEIIEVKSVKKTLTLPYIPGLLSFREMPVILDCFEQLAVTPDLVLVDGQGYAHPRRIGLASHLGLFLGIPTIGCAKSRLCGTYAEPDTEPGSFEKLTDNNETIGAVVRTKRSVKPLFISPGHMIDIETSVQWVLNCCRGYRLPEPTRYAHLAAGGNLTGKFRDSVMAIH